MKRNTCIPASYLIIAKEDEILLLKRFNTGYEDGNYSLIAGHVEMKESFTQCIIREAKEETGIKIEKENLKQVHIMHRKIDDQDSGDRIEMFYKTEKWEGKLENREPEKCSELKWVKIDELPENTIGYIKKAINEIIKNEIYSEYGWE